MKVAVITTINHNVGDDFVREGILFLLGRVIGEFEPRLIHKHAPVTVRVPFAKLYDTPATLWANGFGKRMFEKGSRYLDRLPIFPPTDMILGSDLLVQSGAPIYWLTEQGGASYNNEWFGPLVRKRFDRLGGRVDFLNIGGGTCQPYFSDGSEILADEPSRAYIKEFYDRCLVTTVRDALSEKILEGLGLPATKIVCPSIFAIDRLNIAAKKPEYVAVNFMKQGGHFELGQKIDPLAWERTVVDFVEAVRRETPVLLVCHDEGERALAARLLPDVPVFSGRTAREYLECYSKAVCYVGCRVHGGFATASFGTPAFVIGSDSRARMLEELGLPNVFVKEASVDVLMGHYHDLVRNRDVYRDRLSKVKSDASEAYARALSVLRDRLPGNRRPVVEAG